MGDGAGDHRLFGWRVRSELDLDGLPAWAGDNRAPDVEILFGDVQALGANLTLNGPFVQTDSDGRARLSVQDVGDYLIEDGNRITIAPKMPLDVAAVRMFLVGTALGLLCHQRGLIPLHASVVDIGGQAVALAGQSGEGKSTLAAAFRRRGYAVLSDDVAPLAIEAGRCLVQPGLRHIKLWQDALDGLNLGDQPMGRCRPGLEKFSLPLRQSVQMEPLPLIAVIHLQHDEADLAGPAFKRLRGVRAVRALQHQVYRWRPLLGVAGNMNAMTRLHVTAAHIPYHYVFNRIRRFDALNEHVDAIVRTIEAA